MSRVGKAAEKRVRDYLAENGYQVNQSHISRGPADFLAGKPGQVLAVQVKRTPRSGGGIGVEEWNALIAYSLAFDAVPVIAFAPSIRGLVFYRVTGPKDGSGRRQPWVPFVVDEVA